MKTRHVRVMLLGLMLACGGMACAPKLIGPTVSSGYFFSLRVSDPKIWLMLDGSTMETDIWRIVAKVLTPAEQQNLRALITTWRRKHPTQTMFAYVRFSDFAEERQAFTLAESEKARGLFKSVKEATQGWGRSANAFLHVQAGARLFVCAVTNRTHWFF